MNNRNDMVLQYNIKQNNLNPIKSKLFDDAVSTIKRWSEQHNYRYLCGTTTKFHKVLKNYTGEWGIFDILLTPYYEQFDNILFVDADVFSTPDATDWWEKYKHLPFAACLETPETLKRQTERTAAYKRFDNHFFNSGIAHFSREGILEMKKLNVEGYMRLYKNTKPGRDQLALNMLVNESFGGFTGIDRNDACFLKCPEANDAQFVHIAGRNRDKYMEEFEYWQNHFGVE